MLSRKCVQQFLVYFEADELIKFHTTVPQICMHSKIFNTFAMIVRPSESFDYLNKTNKRPGKYLPSGILCPHINKYLQRYFVYLFIFFCLVYILAR